MLFIVLFVLSSPALAAMGVDAPTAFSAVVACIGNVGPGLGGGGPTDNYSGIPMPGKWVLIFCMLLGRLEICTVLVLFVPEFWRKQSKEAFMTQWIEMGKFAELDETAHREANRLAEYAIDVALDPSQVIRFEETESGFRLLIDEDFYKFYQGI